MHNKRQNEKLKKKEIGKKNYLRDRIQEETGIEILTLDGVLEKFNELLDELYTKL